MKLVHVLAASLVVALSHLTHLWVSDGHFEISLPTSDGRHAKISRSVTGVAEIWAQNEEDWTFATGYMHARDRLVQTVFTRTVAQGRLCELVKDDDNLVVVDRYLRTLGLRHDAAEVVKSLKPASLSMLQRYADGVNFYLNEGHIRPLELLVVGLVPEPWKPEDSILTAMLAHYLGLADTQEDAERAIIDMVKHNADTELLKSLFSPHLNTLDASTMHYIRQLKTYRKSSLPFHSDILKMVPQLKASNNWAVSPSRSQSKAALQANDPHLEVNRLPAVWYETISHLPHNDLVGTQIPGIPGMMFGRNRDVSFGLTFGFMDFVDFFIEEIKDGKVRDSNTYVPLKKQTSMLLRQYGQAETIVTYSTENGVLDLPLGWKETDVLADGYYLAKAYPNVEIASRSMEPLLKAIGAKSAKEFLTIVRGLGQGLNYIAADVNGHIGYQQTGAMPKRNSNHSGLYPMVGWLKENRWNGFVDSSHHTNIYDPAEGIVCSANNDMQVGSNTSRGVILHMGSYRSDRIKKLLLSQPQLTIDDMKSIQCDQISEQAVLFLEKYRHLLPKTVAADALGKWNGSYGVQSKEAVMFERFYTSMLAEVFGKHLFGFEDWHHVRSHTLSIAYFHMFDRILLGATTPEEEKLWFKQESRTELVSRLFKTQLTDDLTQVPVYGQLEERQMTMKNIFFDGTLPSFLHFDVGPFPFGGSRATVNQGQMWTDHTGRVKSFAASYRYVTDLSDPLVHTVIPGGPCGRRFSKYYTTDIDMWRNCQYKTLSLTANRNVTVSEI